MKYVLLMLLPLYASAHVEPGTYTGTTADGKSCSMVAGETYFEGTPHPLNERITITVDGKTFMVGHPPVIDMSKSMAYFNHDVFQGVLPTNIGAQAIEIAMEHSESFEGPRSFTFVDHAWRSDTRATYKCEAIQLIK